MSSATDDLSSQRLISGICSAGIVVFCESQLSCQKLFKRRTTLFFFMAQLAICSSAVMTALSTSTYFSHNLRVLPMLVLISIVSFVQNVSYPIMILLRLRLVRNFPIYIMYIPVILGIVLTSLRYFWIRSIITGGRYCYNVYHIIQPITTIIFDTQYIIINIFFIVIAIKQFRNIVHIRSAVIVNIIVIILECVMVVVEFVVAELCIILCIISIAYQIKVRLEIEILSYIVQSARERERRTGDEDQSVTEGNKFCNPFYLFLSRSRTAGLRIPDTHHCDPGDNH
jgi:hypothetical protein